MDSIASRLAFAMATRKLKIPALVTPAGMTYQGLKKILDGKTASIKYDNLVALCRFLKINPDWLATGEGEMELAGAIDVQARWIDDTQPERAALGMTTALPTLAQALEVLAHWISRADDLSRDQVRPLVNRMFDEPQRSAEIIARIVASVDSEITSLDGPNPTPEDRVRAEQINRAAEAADSFQLFKDAKSKA